MRPISLEFKHNDPTPLYVQLYRYLKKEIVQGNIAAGEKLPSLRRLSADLSISVTTTGLAYNQLLVEGYITSRPQSGYYVANIAPADLSASGQGEKQRPYDFSSYTFEDYEYKYDLTSFDFGKWKKCVSRVLSEYSHMLLFESDPQGEAALRFEISKYV